MKKILNKLREKRGESISEVLIGLLIAAAAVMLLAGMVNASTVLVQRSRDRMDAYYAQNNALNALLETTADSAVDPTAPTAATVTLDMALAPGTGTTVPVVTATNEELNGKVTAYRKK